MPFIREIGQIVRAIDIQGGYVSDPDWVANFDAAGARAAGTNTLVPTQSGSIRFSWGFTDTGFEAVAPDIASRLDIELIALVPDDPDGREGKGIFRLEKRNNLSPFNVHSSTITLVGPTIVVFRTSQLIGIPPAADFLYVAAAVG